MKELKEYEYLDNDFYEEVKDVLEQARKRIYRNIQNEMVLAYWQIGKMIVEKQGGAERAKYGDGLEICVNFISVFQFGPQCVPN